MAFVRRYQSLPPASTLQLTSGIVVIDNPVPGPIAGVGSGTVACIGEFADMRYAVSVANTGAVSTAPVPTEAFSTQDLINKFGGFDSSIGQFGDSMGNGYVAVTNKPFFRLICVPINLCSNYAARLYRQLPPPISATNPSPILPMQAGLVAAGRQFKSSGDVLNVGQAVIFADTTDFVRGTDGAVTAAAATFTSAGSDFVTAGVQIGDALVFGIPGTDADAGTYRVVTVDSATQLTIQLQDGTAFSAAGNDTALPFRVHPAATADTGGNTIAATAAGCLIPVRLTGCQTGTTIAAATVLPPTVVPPAVSATNWDPLSGLNLRTHATQATAYTAAVQAANAASSTGINTLYGTAIDSLLSLDTPASDVNLVFAARSSDTIRGLLKSHVLTVSARAAGRCAVIAPTLKTLTTATVFGNSGAGVGAQRSERVFYSWPGVKCYVAEAAGTSIATADSSTTTDGFLDTLADAWLAAECSNIPPENDPAQAAAPTPTVLANVAGLQRGLPVLDINTYIQMKASGICGMLIDRTTGPQFQDGVTTSLVTGEKYIFRRRMADFIEDSLSDALKPFANLPQNQTFRDVVYSQADSFLNGLLSPDNPAAQRIQAYSIDPKSGNTPEMSALGIYVLVIQVRLLSIAQVIVLNCSISQNVVITQA